MRRSSYTRPPGGAMMTPLRVSNREAASSSNNVRRSSSTTRTSAGGASSRTSTGPAMKRPRVQASKQPAPGAAPRRSSVFGRYDPGVVKDPRPLSDRGYRERCIRKIVDFLNEEGFSHKVTPRTLTTPSSKDVIHIYTFLFAFFDSGYQTQPKSKPEEEIPRMLKMLDYPYPLSRNHMFTIGAQHSWPHVLGGLVWLVDAILTMRQLDPMTLMFPQDDEFNGSEKEILSMHCSVAYQDFLSGGDDFSAHEELLKNKLRERWQQSGNSVEKLQEKNERFREQLDEIRNDPDCVENKEERVGMLQTDVDSHTKYVKQMSGIHENLVKTLTNLHQDRDNHNQDLSQLVGQIKQKQSLIDQQGISPADVLRMNAQTQQLGVQIKILEEQNGQVDDQVWNSEIKLSKMREESDTRCSGVNSLIRKCFPSDDSEQLQLHRNANISQITSCVEKIEIEVRNRVHKAETERDKVRYKQDMIVEKEDSLQKDLQVKQSTNKTLQDEHERFMKTERKEMDKLQNVLDDLQTQIDEVVSHTHDDDSSRLDKTKRRCEDRELEVKQKTEEYSLFLSHAVSAAAQHKLKMAEIFKRIENLPSTFTAVKTRETS